MKYGYKKWNLEKINKFIYNQLIKHIGKTLRMKKNKQPRSCKASY